MNVLVPLQRVGNAMTVESSFDFQFPTAAQEKGLELAKAIGADMPVRAGFVEYRVLQDLTDAGHVQVTTRWDTSDSAHKVLAAYVQDSKVQRATELMGSAPIGFVGKLVTP